jgi:O-antigen/teichoic acid export membrane protein
VADEPPVRTSAFGMSAHVRPDVISRPAILLVVGRTIGLAGSFAIPVILARLFDRAEFGTYKQLFLIYATLYGLAQAGMAESLYFFIPRQPEGSGHRAANALATLALAAIACSGLLFAARTAIAAWLSNPALGRYLPLISVFLAFSLVSAVFEIVLVSRQHYGKAAAVYAGSDLTRTACLVLPAAAMWGLNGVLVGAVVFGALRLGAAALYLWREFGSGLRIDLPLWRGQLAYALPFGLAVGVDIVQTNLHQYFVASRFDAETFAIYAVGCMQIPLVDLICTSMANVMMVKMAEGPGDDSDRRALLLWHDTTCRLATMIFPLAALLLLAARGIITTLFTTRYLASVPIFTIWCLMIVPSALMVDAVLRAYARTRFLLIMNVVRLALIALSIGWFMNTFGLIGAVLVTLSSTILMKACGLIQIARILKVGVADILPWSRLASIAVGAAAAAVPSYWVNRAAAGWRTPEAVAATGLVYTLTFGIWWLLSSSSARARVVALFPPLSSAHPPADATD